MMRTMMCGSGWPTELVNLPPLREKVARQLLAHAAGHFRRAIGLRQRTAERRRQLAKQRLRHRRAAEAQPVERAIIVAVDAVAQHHVEQGRRQRGLGHLVGAHGRGKRLRIEMLGDMQAADQRHAPGRHRIDQMKHRRRMQPDVVAGQFERRHRVVGGRGQIAVGQAGALRLAGRAAGEIDLRDIVELRIARRAPAAAATRSSPRRRWQRRADRRRPTSRPRRSSGS